MGVDSHKEMAGDLTASEDLLLILLNYASQIGFDREEIQEKLGIDLDAIIGQESRIPMVVFNKVWRFVLKQSGDPDFGIHFGQHAHSQLSRHLIYALMLNCANVGEAIRKNFLYHNLIMDVIKPVIREESSIAVLSWEMNHVAFKQERHFSESILSLFVSMLNYLTEKQVKLTEVRFTHSQPKNIDEHHQVFQSSLVFNHHSNEILLRKDFLNKPILLSNSKLLGQLETLVQKVLHQVYASDSWAEKVAQTAFNSIIYEGNASIEGISQKLFVGERTLQMKLKREETTFRQILEKVKKEIAVEYLADKESSICQIALLLGFSDQSSFQNAFKRWTGLTPAVYRKRYLTKQSYDPPS